MDGDLIVDLNARALASFLKENNYIADVEEGVDGEEFVIFERLECMASVFPAKIELSTSVNYILFLSPFQIDLSLSQVNQWNDKNFFSKLVMKDEGTVVLKSFFLTSGITFQHLNIILETWAYTVEKFQQEYDAEQI